jgi:VWFA-related protein
MQPGDLAAVIRTSAGMGALQQFTSDKRLLHTAIDRVRWYPRGSVGTGSFAPIQIDPLTLLERQSPLVDLRTGKPVPGQGSKEDPGRLARIEEYRTDQTFSVGTLGALNFIIKGMGALPGRKSVVMFSEGFQLYDLKKLELKHRVLEELRRLTDMANRASVIIYTIDARGLPTLGLTAEDNTSNLSTEEVSRYLTRRGGDYLHSQAVLNYLSHETGGFAVSNRNDLAAGVERILADQRGFYLIGFRPDEKTFARGTGRPRFNELRVKVKRAGASVRTRAGFFGVTDAEAARPVARTRIGQLFGALSSPVASGDMSLRLTSIFSADPQKGSVISSLMHIDMSGFRFSEEPDGWHRADIDVVALTVGDGGNVVDEVNRTETVRVRGETLRRVLEDGLIYVIAVPVKQPGAYHLRAAVRDAATEKLGSASQFIEVPDLRKNRLALSGLVMEGSGYSAETGAASGAARGAGIEPLNAPDPMGNAAVRRFRQESLVDYHLDVYNARTTRATGRTQLRTQMRIFREGELVFAGRVTPLDPGGQSRQEGTATRVQVSSRFRLGTDLRPGEYVLQVVVTDALAEGKDATAAAWTDFEIIK